MSLPPKLNNDDPLHGIDVFSDRMQAREHQALERRRMGDQFVADSITELKQVTPKETEYTSPVSITAAAGA